jgi:protein-S-isoprenylcysteine O-methyltransferase Ste14
VLALRDELLEFACDVPLLGSHTDGGLARHRLDRTDSLGMLLWIGLLYSLYWTGFGYQTGLTQWWYWFRDQQPPKRGFVTQGAFRYMRHPVYMSFLGLIWFTPVMTLDHAILTAVWTLYIYTGSYFKDRRLLKFIGEPYYEYGKRIPGLPIIGFGSLRFFR